MVRILVVGMLATLSALGALYGVLVWQAGARAEIGKPKVLVPLEQIKTDIISVPMISEGEVKGYVLARFVYLVESDRLKRLSVPPDALLVDEAFKLIYASPVEDFRRIEKYDLAGLTRRLKENVNRRLGAPLVHDVLVDSINYVAKNEIRHRGLKQ